MAVRPMLEGFNVFSGESRIPTAQKMKKSLMENFIFCAVSPSEAP